MSKKMNTDTKCHTSSACKPTTKGLCSSPSVGKKGFYDYMRLQFKFCLLKYFAPRKHVAPTPISHPCCRLAAGAIPAPLPLFGISWSLVVEEFAALRHLYLALYSYSYIIAASGIQPLEASWKLMATQCSVFTWDCLEMPSVPETLPLKGPDSADGGAGRGKTVENDIKCTKIKE